MTTKQEELTRKILTALNKILSDESEEYYIDVEKEFSNGKGGYNYTDFLFALGAIVPTHIYNTLTGEGVGMIQVNHILNSLIFSEGIREAEQRVQIVPTGETPSGVPVGFDQTEDTKTWEVKFNSNVFNEEVQAYEESNPEDTQDGDKIGF